MKRTPKPTQIYSPAEVVGWQCASKVELQRRRRHRKAANRKQAPRRTEKPVAPKAIAGLEKVTFANTISISLSQGTKRSSSGPLPRAAKTPAAAKPSPATETVSCSIFLHLIGVI